jgi:translation initiation factor IF-2
MAAGRRLAGCPACRSPGGREPANRRTSPPSRRTGSRAAPAFEAQGRRGSRGGRRLVSWPARSSRPGGPGRPRLAGLVRSRRRPRPGPAPGPGSRRNVTGRCGAAAPAPARSAARQTARCPRQPGQLPLQPVRRRCTQLPDVRRPSSASTTGSSLPSPIPPAQRTREPADSSSPEPGPPNDSRGHRATQNRLTRPPARRRAAPGGGAARRPPRSGRGGTGAEMPRPRPSARTGRHSAGWPGRPTGRGCS